MSEERKPRIPKTVKTIIGTILLTLAYDYVFSPLFNRIIDTFPVISKSFSNILYKAIAEGYFSDDSYLTFTLVLYILFILGVYYCFSSFMELLKPRNTNKLSRQLEQQYKDLKQSEANYDIGKSVEILDKFDETVSKISRIRKYLMVFWIVAFVVLLVMFGIATSMTSFVHDKKVNVLTKIEIVSPYISDTEYKSLKSEFHLIECKEDYDSLMHKISAIYDKHF